MRRVAVGLLVLSALLLAVLGRGAARADIVTVFQSGVWQGYASYNDSDGSFDHCGISRHQGTSKILIGISSVGEIIVALTDSSWDLGQNQNYTVTFQVDDRAPRRVQGVGDGTLVLFTLDRDWTFLGDLRSGYTLYVTSSAQTLKYSLTGTFAALQQAMQCTLARTRIAGQSNPFGAPGSASSANPFAANASTGLNADGVDQLRVVLLSAGFENVQITTAADVLAEYGEGTLAVWSAGTASDVIGWLTTAAYDEARTPRQVGNDVLAALGETCEGKLAIALDTVVEVAHGTILRGGTACILANNSYYFDVFLSFERPDVYMIVHASSDATRGPVGTATQELVNLFRN